MPRKAPLDDGKVEDSDGERYRILLACWLGLFVSKLMHSYHLVVWCLAPHPIPTGCSALTLWKLFWVSPYSQPASHGLSSIENITVKIVFLFLKKTSLDN